MAEIDITLTDNTGEILKALEENLAAAKEAIGLQAERYAKENCPVDTGRLRNSITHATSDTYVSIPKDEILIGTNVEYAPPQEFNDNYRHKVGRAHFFRDAAADHADTYKEILEKQLKKT